ncbi:hypothetical protein [Aquipluma nitroreducens]|nr:hypothetical protein [Aquipluma nitroreducens]
MKVIISVLIAISICFSGITYAGIHQDFPILVLTSDQDFGEYAGEILKADGFNEFVMEKLSDSKVTLDYISGFDIVILAEAKLSKYQLETLIGYVKNGGNLIAFRPDNKVCDLFGLADQKSTTSEGYISVDDKSDIGKGILTETLQFHGIADNYKLAGAQKIADLFDKSYPPRKWPAVVINRYGRGHAIAFTYNLPKSIVYTRQGNPLFAGVEKDGIPGLRGMDLFTDGWVDTSKNTINQADEHMNLFAHCIEYLSSGAKPLPRFWYLPDSLKCLAVLDNDGEDNNESDFEPQFRDVDSMGAKMTIYIKDVDKVSKEWVDKWTAKGYEIAAHPNDTEEAANPTWNRMDSILGDIKTQIATKFGLPIRTNVNHWFVWVGREADGTPDFAAQAKLEEKHGIEMDANYAHYDMNSNQGRHFLGSPGINQGNYNGSGLVMKYGDPEGKIVNVYQRFNSVYDQQYMERKDPEGFFNCFKGLVDRSLNNEVYSIVSIKSHNNEYYFSKEPLMKMLAYAKDNNIPVWTALELLDFLKMKDEASFTDFNWTKNQLNFKLSSGLKNSHGLTFMLPLIHGGLKIKSITIDGFSPKFEKRMIKGSEYAMVTVNPGKVYTVSVNYN